MSRIPDLVEGYNVVARTEFNRMYKETSPKLKEMVYEYNSGLVASKKFVFTDFLDEIVEFTGSRAHKPFPDGYEFSVENLEWEPSAIDIKRKDLDRASKLAEFGDQITALNSYTSRLATRGKMAKDFPVERALLLLENGDASTYGTTLDAQNMFDTTHDFATSAGTQDNIVTGTCSTLTSASLHADILSVRTRFDSFYYQQGGSSNARKRKLNDTGARMTIIAPVSYSGTLWDLQQKDRLSSGESNTLKGAFDYELQNFTDTNDWYALLLDEPTIKPFLWQVEVPFELDEPSKQDYSYKERKVYSYGMYGRGNVAYGAWWKAIQVTN